MTFVVLHLFSSSASNQNTFFILNYLKYEKYEHLLGHNSSTTKGSKNLIY